MADNTIDLEKNSANNKFNLEQVIKENPSYIVRLDPKIAEQPIYLPDNLFIAKLKDLGVDEFMAFFADPISTGITKAALSANAAAKWIPVSGPIAEKLIFLGRHMIEAKKIYKSTPEKSRKPYGYYLKDGIKHGFVNMTKDLIYHDPLYAGLMVLGMQLTEIHPSLLSLADYVLSVPAAVAIDVGVDYARHTHNIHKLKKAGFTAEKYYESRFFILNEKNPNDVLEMLMKEFNLDFTGTVRYTDRYFDVDDKGLSGRTVRMRIRNRQMREFEKGLWARTSEGFKQEESNMLQIVYTRAKEQKTKNDQCRYYPSKKEKVYAIINPDATSIDQITDDKIRAIGKKLLVSDKKYKPIIFNRGVARDQEAAICVDNMYSDRPFYVLEDKVYTDTRLQKEIMRFIMVECPVVAKQTTYGKFESMIEI